MKDFSNAHLPKIINSIGLLFDIVGALLVWKFGLPKGFTESGHHIFEFMSVEPSAKSYKRWANVGIALLVLGFALQLTSNLIGW